MLGNARSCVKDTTLTTQCFLLFVCLFLLLSFVLLQVFCKIPVNQIIVSTFNQLLYNLVFKKITQTTH